MNKNSSDLIELGELIKPHGLNGEIKLFLYNKKSDILKKGVKVCLERESVLSYLKIEYFSFNNEVADQRVPFDTRPLASNSWPIPASKILIFLKKSLFINL